VTAHAASSLPAEEPEDLDKSAPSGRLLLRMPRTLHADLAQAAEREGTSLNQFITAALATKVGSGPDEARSEPSQTQSRVIAAALVANAVVIGLAAVAAIAVLIVALLG
jgi:multisubunit Na+/H+ antiporter MnhC subunit